MAGTLYEPASAEVRSVVLRAMDLHHPDLAEAKVELRIVMAYAAVGDDGEVRGPAMSTKGFRILAKIKRNTAAQRAAGHGDVTLTIDGDNWRDWSDDGREDEMIALIDHEFCHVTVARYPDVGERRGPIKLETDGRPKLGTRHHDYELTGFHEVAERHGAASVEVREARRWHDAGGNLLFHFANDLAGSTR